MVVGAGQLGDDLLTDGIGPGLAAEAVVLVVGQDFLDYDGGLAPDEVLEFAEDGLVGLGHRHCLNQIYSNMVSL